MGNIQRKYTRFKIGDRVLPIDPTELWAIGTALTVVDIPLSKVSVGRSLKLRVQGYGCDRVFYTIQPDNAFKKSIHPRLGLWAISEVAKTFVSGLEMISGALVEDLSA